MKFERRERTMSLGMAFRIPGVGEHA